MPFQRTIVLQPLVAVKKDWFNGIVYSKLQAVYEN